MISLTLAQCAETVIPDFIIWDRPLKLKNLSAKIEPNFTNILLLNILRGKLGYVAFSTVDINIEVVRINSGGDALG